MSTRVHAFTIPSAFRRLDTRVTDPDTPISARDRQVARQNVNILLARRVRQPILTLQLRADGLVGGGWQVPVYGYPSENMEATASILVSTLIEIPGWVPSLKLNVRVSKTAGDADIVLYPFVHRPWSRLPRNTEDPITVNATSITYYTTTVTVDGQDSQRQTGMHFTLAAAGALNTADTGADTAYTDVGPDWIQFASAAIAAVVGDVLYCVDDPSITPRMITNVATVGTATRYYITPPWDSSNSMSDDGLLFNARTTAKLTIESLMLTAWPVTDFGEGGVT